LGVSISEIGNESVICTLGTKDPAVKEAGLTFEVYSMPGTVVRKQIQF